MRGLMYRHIPCTWGERRKTTFFCIDTLWLSLYTYDYLILSFNPPCVMRCKVPDEWPFFLFPLSLYPLGGTALIVNL